MVGKAATKKVVRPSAHLCQRQRIELTWKRAMNRCNDDRGPYPRINRNRVVTLAVTRTWEIGSFSNKRLRYTIATLRHVHVEVRQIFRTYFQILSVLTSARTTGNDFNDSAGRRKAARRNNKRDLRQIVLRKVRVSYDNDGGYESKTYERQMHPSSRSLPSETSPAIF